MEKKLFSRFDRESAYEYSHRVRKALKLSFKEREELWFDRVEETNIKPKDERKVLCEVEIDGKYVYQVWKSYPGQKTVYFRNTRKEPLIYLVLTTWKGPRDSTVEIEVYPSSKEEEVLNRIPLV